MGPFRFKPLLKQTLWGGEKIAAFKHLDTTLGNVGESWEISGIRGSETVVSEGEYAGMSLPPAHLRIGLRASVNGCCRVMWRAGKEMPRRSGAVLDIRCPGRSGKARLLSLCEE